MKYILYLLGVTYIISAIVFAKFFYFDEKKKNRLEEYKNKIVIIIPETKVESFQNNPGGIINENTDSGIGAGFFISDDGNIQTVNHLVENENLKYKVIYNKKEYYANIISRNPENDLSKIKITDLNVKFPFFEIEEADYDSEGIYSFGVDIKNLKITYSKGKIINKKSKLENKSNLLEISNKLIPGFSGGPIINSNGKVIGVNYAISKGKNYGINLVK